MSSDAFKKADMDFFQKQIDSRKENDTFVQNTIHLVSHFIPHLQTAMDLTNDNIPLKITKCANNLYFFERVVPQKLIFKSVEDAKKIANTNALLSMFVEQPIILPNTKISRMKIEIVNFNYFESIVSEFTFTTKVCLLLSIIGIPIFGVMYWNYQDAMKQVKKGFEVKISGFLEINE